MNRNHLLENKNHLIDKLNLTLDQKNQLKAFFLKHPSYENKVDWNNKSLTYEDFKPLLNLEGKSKTQAKKNGLAGLVEGKDYVDFGTTFIEKLGESHIYQPLTYLGSKTLASNAVAPVKKNGAQWCIAYQKTSEYWYDYSNDGIKFLFIFNDSTKYALTIYPSKIDNRREVYSFNDSNLGYLKVFKKNDYINSCIQNLHEVEGPTLNEILEIYKDALEIDSNGYVSLKEDTNLSIRTLNKIISFLTKNGKFICKFGIWRDSFLCYGLGLTSLEGAPEEVWGDFLCGNNKLTSLKGAPKKIDGYFSCSRNELLSLEGSPKKINKDFNCTFNKLTSLKGAPRIIGRDFLCFDNQLTSLKDCPIYIGGILDCSGNPITTLEDVPSSIDSSKIIAKQI